MKIQFKTDKFEFLTETTANQIKIIVLFMLFGVLCYSLYIKSTDGIMMTCITAIVAMAGIDVKTKNEDDISK